MILEGEKLVEEIWYFLHDPFLPVCYTRHIDYSAAILCLTINQSIRILNPRAHQSNKKYSLNIFPFEK